MRKHVLLFVHSRIHSEPFGYWMKCSRVRERMVCLWSVGNFNWWNRTHFRYALDDIFMFVSHDFRCKHCSESQQQQCCLRFDVQWESEWWHIRFECDSINIFSVFIGSAVAFLLLLPLPLLLYWWCGCADKMNQVNEMKFKWIPANISRQRRAIRERAIVCFLLMSCVVTDWVFQHGLLRL